jgi:hypothetical protein
MNAATAQRVGLHGCGAYTLSAQSLATAEAADVMAQSKLSRPAFRSAEE